MAVTGHPITSSTTSTPASATVTAQPVIRQGLSRVLTPVARRAMPLVTSSVGAAIATLAAEQALGALALRTVERAGFVRATPEDGLTRVTVTHTTIVERIVRRG